MIDEKKDGLSSYDIKVISSLNRIQNSNEINSKDLTSWIVTKNLTPRLKDSENQHVLRSLEKLNEMGIVCLEVENIKKITKNKKLNIERRIWSLNKAEDILRFIDKSIEKLKILKKEIQKK